MGKEDLGKVGLPLEVGFVGDAGVFDQRLAFLSGECLRLWKDGQTKGLELVERPEELAPCEAGGVVEGGSADRVMEGD